MTAPINVSFADIATSRQKSEFDLLSTSAAMARKLDERGMPSAWLTSSVGIPPLRGRFAWIVLTYKVLKAFDI